MDLGYVKKLIKMLSESDVDEIEIEEEGKKVRLVKHQNNAIQGLHQVQVPVYQQSIQPPAAPQSNTTPHPGGAAPSRAQASPDNKLHEIKSPIVGTFYKAPAPDAAAFVEVGSTIQPGTVLCIVEAMKLMNEIESDVSGRISKVMVENGQAIEYGQPLFLVELS
jgi:acetyl-CoA carboxylase biotin carboxyl carrier protein